MPKRKATEIAGGKQLPIPPIADEPQSGPAAVKSSRRSTESSSGASSSSTQEWTEQEHREFASAIYDIGVANSSPAVILENMKIRNELITSERVKSKLQKYRNNREKSRQEFLEDYDSFLFKAKAIEMAAGGTSGASVSPQTMLEMMGAKRLLGGDVAAFLSYSVMKDRAQKAPLPAEKAARLSPRSLRKGALDYVDNFAGQGIAFPELTEEEKKSSLGVSLTFVMGLFLSMTQHLLKERDGNGGRDATNGPLSGLNLKEIGGLPPQLEAIMGLGAGAIASAAIDSQKQHSPPTESKKKQG